MLELRAKVFGKVQGVGFRATTERFARELGLQGTVCNCSDGTVELVAQGERKELDQLITNLKENFSSHIKKIDVEIVNPRKLYSTFIVS